MSLGSTYIYVGYDFNYLSLITNADLRRCLHRVRSDRGVQYCSFEYVKNLMAAGITISMIDSGEAYENPGPNAQIVAGPCPKGGMEY